MAVGGIPEVEDVEEHHAHRETESRLIDRLCKKGLTAKHPCKDDKRANRVFITEKGLELLTEIDPKATLIDHKIGHLTEEEVRQLNDLLVKIRG